jgi:hypothetical protein
MAPAAITNRAVDRVVTSRAGERIGMVARRMKFEREVGIV